MQSSIKYYFDYNIWFLIKVTFNVHAYVFKESVLNNSIILKILIKSITIYVYIYPRNFNVW